MVGKKIKVRLLLAKTVDGVNYPAGAAVEFPEKTAKSLVAEGAADDHRDAVEYAVVECGGCAVHVSGEPELIATDDILWLDDSLGGVRLDVGDQIEAVLPLVSESVSGAIAGDLPLLDGASADGSIAAAADANLDVGQIEAASLLPQVDEPAPVVAKRTAKAA